MRNLRAEESTESAARAPVGRSKPHVGAVFSKRGKNGKSLENRYRRNNKENAENTDAKCEGV